MMKTRRLSIEEILGNSFDSTAVNASLWLDKYIEDSTNDKNKQIQNDAEKPRVKLVKQVVSIEEPAIYKDYFENTWKKHLDNLGAKYRWAKVRNRLAINLGTESVLETNIALHRIFGVPFIPGSSLKGMTAAFIRQYGNWKKNNEIYISIFGDQNNAGFITFYDALYVPGSGYNQKPLYADVMTTHHQDYYGEKKENGQISPPADWDSPNPVPFISATGEYLIALSAPQGCEDLLELTFDILGFALAAEGVGAKTSSGYGRMDLQDENGQYSDKYKIAVRGQAESNQAEQISQSERIAAQYLARIEVLRETDVAGQIPQIAQECLNIEDETARKIVAKAILNKVEKAGRTKKSSEKSWFQKIVGLLENSE